MTPDWRRETRAEPFFTVYSPGRPTATAHPAVANTPTRDSSRHFYTLMMSSPQRTALCTDKKVDQLQSHI